MRAVEAGNHVEGARVSAVAEDQSLVHQPVMRDEAKVLVKLSGEEPRAAQRSQRQKEHRLFAIAFGGRSDRQHHRDAGANKQESEERGEGNSQGRVPRMTPDVGSSSKDAVRQEQSAEGECVREQEDPHPNLPWGGASKILVRR